MSPADLRRLVNIGEGYHLEFKRRVSSPVRIAREAIALANTWGGTILVGVDDDGSIPGLKDTEEELFDLRRAFGNHCSPAIPFSHEIVPVSRKRDVIAATVLQSRTKPHALVGSDSGSSPEIFVRVHEQTVVASPEIIELMKHEHSTEDVFFEFGDNELLLLRYLESYDSIRVDQFARVAAISEKAASSTLVALTRAGVTRLIPGEKGDVFVINREGKAAAS